MYLYGNAVYVPVLPRKRRPTFAFVCYYHCCTCALFLTTDFYVLFCPTSKRLRNSGGLSSTTHFNMIPLFLPRTKPVIIMGVEWVGRTETVLGTPSSLFFLSLSLLINSSFFSLSNSQPGSRKFQTKSLLQHKIQHNTVQYT